MFHSKTTVCFMLFSSSLKLIHNVHFFVTCFFHSAILVFTHGECSCSLSILADA